MMFRLLLSVLSLLLAVRVALSQAQAPVLLSPDDRYKADLLLIVAHPDDDVVIGGYLARIALDEHKRVAVFYCTNGEAAETLRAMSLAHRSARSERSRLAARSLTSASTMCGFCRGTIHPGQNVLRSLDNWNHGRALDDVVRLVRITRPDVILTWLPDPVVGENHDDHQASSVLAVEAFDAAGDPPSFLNRFRPRATVPAWPI